MNRTEPTWWKLDVGLSAIATYQAYPVGHGVDPQAGQRQLMVWAVIPLCVPARTLPEAQTLVPEVLVGFESHVLLASAQIFSMTRVPPPRTNTMVGLELIDVDQIALYDAQAMDF